MNLETFIYEVVNLRYKYGQEITVTPDEAVDLFKRTGDICREAEWVVSFDGQKHNIYMDRLAFYNVPCENFTLGELLHNVSIALRLNLPEMIWE